MKLLERLEMAAFVCLLVLAGWLLTVLETFIGEQP